MIYLNVNQNVHVLYVYLIYYTDHKILKYVFAN